VWFGVAAPAGVPQDIVDRLSRALNEALKDPAAVKLLAAEGLDIKGGTPEAFGSFVASETRKYGDVANAAGLRK
jgi:tripartite-type tricarboxylate transporter receptor subunit TctC